MKATNTLGVAVAGCVIIALLGLYALLSHSDTLSANTAAEKPAAEADLVIEERALGDKKAPVVIEEYAALSCSHCAHFHKDILEKLKEKYIDTGKVRFIFNDFPFNAPSLDASMIARCMPQERFFPFIKMLFETQESWAYGNNHREMLRQNAKLAGMSDETFNSCLANDKLKQALVDKMKKVAQDKKISSTPSFVINGKDVISGAMPVEEFSKVIDPLLGEKK